MAETEGFELLGYGPSATGSGASWSMRADLFARCGRCGDVISLDAGENATCSCGALRKDADAGRFGSDLGDNSIAILRQSAG